MKRTGILISFFITILFSRCGEQTNSAEELSNIVTELNKKCPQVIDSETRLDGLAFKAPNTLVYNYTLLNINVHLLDTHQFYLAMWPGLLSTIKISSEMKKLRDNNATIEYAYQDKLKQPVYVFKITPKDYN
jgi:hypothetical protein